MGDATAQGQGQGQKPGQKPFKRKQIYINFDLQFKYSLILIFTMIVEMIVVGLALLYVLSQPQPEVPGSNIYHTYQVVLGIIIFLTLCNITVGVYLSHKVAGPLFRFVMVSKEIADGNLRIQANLRRGDELRELENAFNEMTEKLRAAVRKDRVRLDDIRESLDRIEKEAGKNAAVAKAAAEIRETSDQLTKYFTI